MIISLHNSQCIQLLLHTSIHLSSIILHAHITAFAVDGISPSQIKQNSDFSSLCAQKFRLEGAQTVQVRAKTRFQPGCLI